MSTIIRDAVIRLRIEQQKGQLESPGGSGASKAYEELDKAAKEAAASIREAINASKEWNQGGSGGGGPAKTITEVAKATDAWAAGLRKVNDEWKKSGSGRDSWGEGLGRMKEQKQATNDAAEAHRRFTNEAAINAEELRKTTTVSSREMVIAFREGGEGAVRLARGIAFLSASGSDDLRKLIQQVAIAQGAFDVFAGGAKMLTHLGAAFGPVGVGVAAVTAAVIAGVTWWRSWANAAEEAGKRADEAAKKFSELSQQRMEAQNSARSEVTRAILESVGANVDVALTPEQEYKRVQDAQQRLRKEREATKSRDDNLRNLLFKTDPTLVDPNNLARTDPAQARQLAGYAERQASILAAERDMERQRFEIEKKRAEEQRAAMSNVFALAQAGAMNPMGGIGTVGVAQAGGNLISGFDAQVKDMTDRAQKALDTFVSMMEESARRAAEFREALRQQESANSS